MLFYIIKIKKICQTSYFFYIYRETKTNNIVEKHTVKFKDLSIESQLYILEPYKFQTLKELSQEFKNYPDL